MKDITSSVYTFDKLILGNYLYIDKTEYLWKLVQPSCGIYFLSRPRRFGKSLALSTLEAIFHGKRELFKGLAIESKPYNWTEYPIIHLDFANCAVKDGESLRDYLYFTLCSLAQEKDVHPFMNRNHLGLSFSNLIAAMDRGQGVVILVDEYDKPLLNNLTESSAMQEMLPVIKGFYSAIKASEAHERFVLVTGVTKFCHVSLFSDLNNLQDISTDEQFTTMLGYTQQELETNFEKWLLQIEEKRSLSHKVLLNSLKLWYDGYRFAANAETVYNPVSIANFFIKGGNFENYWFTTGTVSSLFQMMRQNNITLPDLMEQPVNGSLFESFELSDVDIQKLMYQTGYLTIGETEIIDACTENEEHIYHLRFPNNEVKGSFQNQIMEHYAGVKSTQSMEIIRGLTTDLQNGDINNLGTVQK